MSPTTEGVLATALALPEVDRFELVEALIASLAAADRPPVDESWGPVVRRRSAELASGAVAAVSWDEVKRQARERTGG